ncbi:MAG: RimK/LysX family protein [Planctomycetota bacterium]
MDIEPPPDWQPPDLSLPPETPVADPLLVIGWREWVSLPDLGIRFIKAKIDTGARSSSLHAFDIEPFEADGRRQVRFKVHPAQRNETWDVSCTADVADVRSVRSSSGEASERIVIQTPLRWMGQTWLIDLTLASRFEMGFRMLIGREAIRGRLLVDSGQSFFGPKPRRKKRRKTN